MLNKRKGKRSTLQVLRTLSASGLSSIGAIDADNLPHPSGFDDGHIISGLAYSNR